MSEVFKNFKSGEKKITTTATHKQWEINTDNSSSYGVKWGLGQYVKGPYNFNIEDPLQGGDNTLWYHDEATSQFQDITYAKTLYDSINHLYYDGADNPWDVFCNDHPSKNFRDINGIVGVLSIPSTIFGERIKPGTFGYSQSNMELRDDSYGNLYDPNDYSGSQAATYKDNCIFYLPLSEGYKHFEKATDIFTAPSAIIGTSSLRVESNGNFTSRAYNVQYFDDKKTWGSQAIFHGSQSLQESHSIDNPSDNAVIVIEGTKDYEVPDHWALSLYILAPESQSISGSYIGPRQNDRTDRLRELEDKGTNTIITSREWYSQNMPFELSIINSSHADAGKLQFNAKSKTEGEAGIQIKTSTIINEDNKWHHVFILATNDEVKLYLDGTQEGGTSTYSYKNKNTRLDADIHIGARPFGYKTKYYHSGSQKMKDNKKNKNYIKPFSGSIDQVRFYDLTQEDSDSAISGIDADMINCISESINQTNIVGNIFYDHGIAAITPPLYGKANVSPLNNYINWWNTDPTSGHVTCSFQSTHLIKEHLYICNILDGEFNSTYNITARQNNDPMNDNLQAYTTHSEFNPYITSIGLYNDHNELLAVGKLAQPVKNQDDYDNTFQIRFDTTI